MIHLLSIKLKILTLAIITLMVIVAAGFFVIARKESTQPDEPTAANVSTDCPRPLTLATPVDTALVTSMLWPGQVRGDGFRAHGGFRFDTSQPDDIKVVAPLAARLTAASRYLEQGEEQYLLFFSSPCGLNFRFDHVRSLSPKLAAALADLPPAKPNDSRTTNVTGVVTVTAGEEISHSVGISATNVFVDFGLYTPSDFTTNGVCFFDYLPSDDSTQLRSLPTGNEGKQSDYCRDEDEGRV